MNRHFVTFAALVLAACALAYVPHLPILPLVESGAIKTWSTGENLTSTDLNANFSHIHSNMVGGHGGRLIDADVSASAAISSSKLAAYRLIPVAWATVSNCTGSPCTILSSSGVSSVTRSGAGSYVVNMSTARTDLSYSVIASYFRDTGGGARICYATAIVSTTQTGVVCASDFVPTAADSGFSVVIYDNN